ncbi:hypothetical protein PENTCL1PPCAC_19591, partial [Pristionchus entomophagus]
RRDEDEVTLMRRRRRCDGLLRPGRQTPLSLRETTMMEGSRRSSAMRPARTASWQILRMPSLLLVYLAVISFPLAEAVKCYCTDDHCVPYGACEGNACLVGILKESNQVIRTCGNQKIGCFRDVDEKWADLCVCSDAYCNTFSFLRQNTQKEKPHTFPQPVISPEHVDEGNGHSNGNGYFKTHQSDFHDDDDSLVFHRMDRPDDGPVHNPDAPLATSFVTILLVVVPLTVGALTVVIVSFNYYCHLC